MTKEIRIEFKLTQQEYVALARLRLVKVGLLRLVLTGILEGIAVLFITVTWLGNIAQYPWIILLSFLSFITLTIIYTLFIPYYHFHRVSWLRSEFTMKFSDNDILVKTASQESNLKWDYFDKAWATHKGYILTGGIYKASLIPRRTFSQEQELDFRELLKTKLKCSL